MLKFGNIKNDTVCESTERWVSAGATKSPALEKSPCDFSKKKKNSLDTLQNFGVLV